MRCGRSLRRPVSRGRPADDCLAIWRVREAVNVNQDRFVRHKMREGGRGGEEGERETERRPFSLNWPLATSLLELLLPTSTNDCRAVANLP